MRTACSSYDGYTSMMSPRTRKVPRPNSTSFRSYWMSTSFRRICSRSIRWPISSGSIIP